MRHDARRALELATLAAAAAGAAYLIYRYWAGPAPARRVHDYSTRSGFPAPPEQMRGLAGDFDVPEDFRTPEPLRPFRRDLH